ncbi:LamG-like jellyroll fold domain-containing protein [Brevibacillus dissolubilis]|uniref:LamG-like jellyroll fold domain-containing protein n=1 Tax=Brevibacillus dissolubilis TaxID=1844116 RepID=UPI001116A8E0|nr:LamG-like jellyroll fold domain-containing protein [Brevibacillus dissolubilis]
MLSIRKWLASFLTVLLVASAIFGPAPYGDVETAHAEEASFIDLVPKMTNYTTPIGTASSSSGISYYLFDDKTGTGTSFTYDSTKPEAAWFKYAFPAQETIYKYSFTPYTDASAPLTAKEGPSSWQLYGSNNPADESAWEKIGGTMTASNWEYGKKKEFVLAQPVTYQAFKVIFTGPNAYNSTSKLIRLGEVELIGPYHPQLLLSADTINEAHANNGSVTETQTITLSSGSFVTGMTSSDVIVNNLPEGLETTVTVPTGSTNKLKLAFTKNASFVGSSVINHATITIPQSKIIGLASAAVPSDLTSKPFTFSVTDNDLVPKMTNDTEPIGTASASGGLFYKIFDDSISSGLMFTYDQTKPGSIWFQYTFPAQETIFKYSFTPYTESSMPLTAKEAPTSWQLYGSNDPANPNSWQAIGGNVTASDWTFGVKKEFMLDEPVTYQAYKVVFTGPGGNNTNTIRLGEVELIGAFNPRLQHSAEVINETHANNGSVTETQVITLTSGTFASDITNADVIVNNLPEGLVSNAKLENDNRSLRISFTGNAANVGSSIIDDASVTVNKNKIIGINYTNLTSDLTTKPFKFSVKDADLVPKMTGDTTPSGTASASPNSGLFYKIFDDVISSGLMFTYDSTKPGSIWFQYTFPAQETIFKYTMTPFSDVSMPATTKEAPASWQLYGSNEPATPSSWQAIGGNQTASDWKLGVKKEFMLDQPVTYKAYKVVFTGPGGNNTNTIRLGEVEFIKTKLSPILQTSLLTVPEADANDGSITTVQNVRLTNASFADDLGTGVTVHNLPEGIGYQVTRISNQEFTVSFTGQAVYHTNSNDVKNAYVTVDPAKITGATTAVSSNMFEIDFKDPVIPKEPPHGDSLYFDGEDDKLLADNLSSDLTANAQTTVEFWVKWKDRKNKAMPFSWNGYYDLEFVNGYFGFNTGENNLLGIPVNKTFDDWAHVAAVFTNGQLGADRLELYVNGQKQQLQHYINPVMSNRTVTKGIVIGNFSDVNRPDYDFKGWLADVRVWRGARTESQIMTDLVHGLSGNENGLIGNWKLSELSTQTAYDNTSYQNQATGYNFAASGLNPQAAEVTPTAATLTWTPHSKADSYAVYRDGQVIYEGTDTSFTDSTVSLGNAYTYSVYAKNQFGESVRESIDIAVSEPEPTVEFLTAEPSSITLEVYGTQQLTVNATMQDGTTEDATSQAVYTSDDSLIATVGANGLLTGVSEGNTIIQISYAGLTVYVPLSVVPVTSPAGVATDDTDAASSPAEHP